jgi:hypothetical protein
VSPVTKQRCPPARSGIAVTRAVSVDRYLFRAAAFRHANTIPVPALIRRGFLYALPGLRSPNNLPGAASRHASWPCQRCRLSLRSFLGKNLPIYAQWDWPPALTASHSCRSVGVSGSTVS